MAARRPQYEPYREQRGEVFRWRLGVRPLDPADWLVLDEHADHELAAKHRVMAEHPATAFAVIDGIDAEVAEVTEAIVAFLRERHRTRYATVSLDPALHPLDAAGRLVQEDLVLMVEREGRLVFGGGSVCFPNRWDLRSKLGRTMAEVHDPVAELNAQLGRTIDDFLARLRPGKPVWRLGWGVLDTDDLYQPADGTAAPRPVDAAPADHHLRVERETLRRFPRTGCVLFTIHTHVTPLPDVAAFPDSAAALADALESLPPSIAAYKQLDHTKAMLAAWLRSESSAVTAAAAIS